MRKIESLLYREGGGEEMDVFKHTSIPLSKRNGRAYVSYQMLAYRRDCTVIKAIFFQGIVAPRARNE